MDNQCIFCQQYVKEISLKENQIEFLYDYIDDLKEENKRYKSMLFDSEITRGEGSE